jgi:UDP-glucose 4-epimerase
MAGANKPALVTGGCGFVGRRVVRRLLRDGRAVWIVDDCSTGLHPDEWLSGVEACREVACDVVEYSAGAVTFVRCDVRDFFADRVDLGGLREPEFGDVFHFAAIMGGRATIERKPLAVAANLALDAECFIWAAEKKPERLLYASSSAAYPIDLQSGSGTPLAECEIRFGGRLGQPDMTYGWAKLTGEYLARVAHEHYGLRTVCVRPFSGYGEDQDVSYPIPSIAMRAANREDPLTVWGSGDQGRDFVHIDDCTDAMLRALDRIGDGSAVNIGSGRLVDFREVARTFARLEGYEPRITCLEDKPAGVRSRFADVAHMRRVLDWEPAIGLEEGFARVLEAAHARTSSARAAHFGR